MNMLFLFLLAVSTFAIGKAKDHEIVYPRMIVSRSGEKQVFFRAFDKDFHLRLEPADAISDNLVVVTRDDKGERIYFEPDVEHMRKTILQDRKVGATISVDDSGPLKIKGVINENLRIEPDLSSHYKGEGTEQEREELVEDVPHRVVKVTHRIKESGFYNDGVVPPIFQDNSTYEISTEARANEMIVEVTVISDIKHTSILTDKECCTYHTILINCVNLRFQTMTESKIKVVISKIIRCFKSTDQLFIDSNTVQGHALSEPTLKALSTHCYNNQRDCDGDVIMLVTAQPMGDIDEGTGKINPGVIGIAYVGGACNRRYKVGISEDNGKTFSGCLTFAHELAHLLSCGHDGDPPAIRGSPGSADCSWNLGMIMSYISKDENQYVFSKCCDKSVLHFASLSSSACLFRNDTAKIVYSKDNRLPGTYLCDTAGINCNTNLEAYYDIKCKLSRDDWYLYKVSIGTCLQSYSCRAASSGRYFSYWTFDSGPGDPCGTNKICKSGYCVNK